MRAKSTAFDIFRRIANIAIAKFNLPQNSYLVHDFLRQAKNLITSTTLNLQPLFAPRDLPNYPRLVDSKLAN